MWVIQYMDWHGTMEELEELDKYIEKDCKKIEGVEFVGRYAPHNVKYHWAHFFKVKDYNQFQKIGNDWPRDYNKASHFVINVFT